MSKELPKTYDPKEFEDRLYKDWMDNDYFAGIPDENKKPFCIVIPPPNITGQLHMGHALNNTYQDILVRWRRMQGYSTLWLPGTDHASIATEAKIVEAMALEGIKKEDIGREKFLERAWEWKKHYGGRIVEQLKKLGSSCDWSKERFTMDEGLSDAVVEVFVRLYEKGSIYRGERIINWCPHCITSISDAEVDFEEKEGNLWYIRYPIKDSDQFIVVATTRPETMLGDTAVAVNPKDERFKHLAGKMIILPLVNREIPVVFDDYVDIEFGTGAVKITPAHDPNDFEVGARHELPVIKVMDDKAVMNANAGKYVGLDRYEARKKIVEDLKALNLLEKTQAHVHNVGQCYRCSTVIEPTVSLQWFVSMKHLAEPAIEAVRSGAVKFVPERFAKTYYNWMENIQDWCISRQLWWGHRIPAYYCRSCGNTMVAKEMPDICPKCRSANIEQDNDTLDTWFSSALWPFSTLGWPEKTKELQYYYPTNVLVTAYDIIFFWVARMIFSGLEHMNEKPFDYVFMHGVVRDAAGKKMSKSLGNGIDPLEIIEQFGTDALRYALTIGTAPGNDLRFSPEKCEASRNFANKVWNASRFVLMNFDDAPAFDQISPAKFTVEDKWILSRINSLTREVSEKMERFEIGIALQKVYEFVWEEFCDWYIEIVKQRLYDKECSTRLEAQYVLNYVLCSSLKLLHPYMPFVTAEIYSYLVQSDASIMIAKWPEYREDYCFEKEETRMIAVMDAIRNIRNIRSEMNVPPSRKARTIFVASNVEARDTIEESKLTFERLASASTVEIHLVVDTDGEDLNNIVPEDAVSARMQGAQIFMPMEELIDMQKELERLEKERDNLITEMARLDAKLANPGFIDKAPAKVVEEERLKRTKYEKLHEKVMERLNTLKKG